jgi:hypothetical protein
MNSGLGKESFPNMTSLIRYEVWRDGIDRVNTQSNTIINAKARTAARLLFKQDLVTITEEDELLVLRPIKGTVLDRVTHPDPPDDVKAYV